MNNHVEPTIKDIVNNAFPVRRNFVEGITDMMHQLERKVDAMRLEFGCDVEKKATPKQSTAYYGYLHAWQALKEARDKIKSL